MFCFDAIHRLESTDYGVDVVRIDLDPIAMPSGFLGCDQCGAASSKSVENDLTVLGTIENCVGYEGYCGGRRHDGESTIFAAKNRARFPS